MNLALNKSISSFGSISNLGDADNESVLLPANKESAWVYPKGTDVTKDKSKTHQGVWQTAKFSLATAAKRSGKRNQELSKDPEEVWIFRDDDPQGIDPRVLEKNPLKGKWGYGPAVKKKKRGAKNIILQKNIDPQDMWFFHPNTKDAEIPSNCVVMGEWIQPFAPALSKSKSDSGKKGWSLFGKGGERRKIIPGRKKKQESSEGNVSSTPEKADAPAADTSDDSIVATPKKKTKKKSTPKKNSSVKSSDTSATPTSKKKRSSSTKKAPTEGKPPTTPTSKKNRAAKPSTTPKPSSIVSMNSSLSSSMNLTLNSSMSSIKSPSRNKTSQSITTPNSPGSLNSSLASLSSSKRSLGSDDFQLTIRRQPTLETFTLIVQPTYKIAQVKQKINRSRGIPMDAISLSYNDKLLDKVGNKENLKTLGIRNHSTVDIAGFTIYFRTPKGRKYVCSNTDVEILIDSLRQIASEKDKQPIEKIGLYFNRVVLQNGTLLSKYKVKTKSVIEIKYDGAGHKSAAQKVYTRRANVPRKRVAPTVAPPPRKPSVTLKKPVEAPQNVVTIVPAQSDKPSIPVALDEKDTTDDILRKAAKAVGAVLSDFVLTNQNGEAITTENYDPENGDTLHVAPIATVQLPGGDIVKEPLVPGQNTVEHFKGLICDAHEIPIDSQLLLVDDEEVADSAVITNDIILRLIVKKPPKTIYIRDLEDDVHTVVLQHDETSLDLWNTAAEIAGMDMDELCLGLDETDEELDYDEYTPTDGDVLAVMVPPSTITVTLPNGDKFELEVMPTATIGELKSVLEEETGTTESEHRIFPLDGPEELGNDVQLSEDMDLRLELRSTDASENDQGDDSDQDEEENPTPQISIAVTKADGQNVCVKFDPNVTAMDARKQIADTLGVPIRELRLSKDSEEVKKGYMPHQDDILKVMPPRLIVKTPEGDSFHIDIRPNDTAVTVRERIAKQAGVPAADMMLMKGDKEVETSYVPSDGDEIRLKPRRITVKTSAGTVFQLTINSNDTPETIWSKISEEASVPTKDLILFKADEKLGESYMPSNGDVLVIKPAVAEITLPDGSKLDFPTKSNTTVDTVKGHVELHRGIKKNRIALLDEDDQEMGDDVPVGKDSAFTVQIKKNTLTIVARDESTFSLDVECDKNVDFLRNLIAQKTGIPIGELRLSMDEEELPGSYIPLSSDIVTIEPPTVVVTLPDGELLELAASNDTTIGDIKEVLEEESGISVQEQKLCLVGSSDPLDDAMPISNDLEIRLEKQEATGKNDPFVVTIQTPDEQTLSVEILPEDSQAEFRRKIARAAGVPNKDMRLSKDDEEIAENFSPSAGDVLELMPPTITVELPDRELLELEALTGTNIGDIKDALEEETGISKAKQCMFLLEGSNGVPLADDTLIAKDISVKLEESTSIKVTGLDDKTFEMMVLPRSDLKTLKRNIGSIVGVPSKDIRLSKGKEEIKSCTFCEGDAITVLPPRVFVQVPDGKRSEFGVLPTHTIADLKAKIAKKTGMPVESQHIHFLQKEDELDDGTMFSRSDFVDGTVLRVQYEKPEVTVVMPDGRKLEFSFEISDTKNDVRYKIARELNVLTQDLRLIMDGCDLEKTYKPRNGHVLHVQAQAIKVGLPGGSQISLSVMPTQTIADLKDAIETMTETPMDSFSVFLDDGDTALEEDSPVSRYDFDNSTVLTIRSPDDSVEIDVDLPDGRSFKLVIDSEKTLPEMRCEIEEQFGLRIGGIRLNGELVQLPDNASLLTHLGTSINRNATLLVDAPEIRATLPNGEVARLQVMPSMTVGDLEKQIASMHPDLDMECHDIIPRNGGEPIDGRTSVKNIDLDAGFVLQERPQEMAIQINLTNGEIFSVHVMPDDDIDALREQIASITKVLPDHQHLTFNSQPIEDGKSLGDQGIHKGVSISLEPMRIRLEQASGKQIEIAVRPDFDFRKLKQLISDEISVAVDDQYLSFDGDRLQDKVLLSDSDVCNGDIVILEMYSISVLCWSGDVIRMDDIGSKNTIQDVMESIRDQKEVPIEKQRIMLGGQPLTDDTRKTLKDLGIQHKDVLMLDNPEKVDTSATATPKSTSKCAFSFLQKASSLLSSPKVHEAKDEENVSLNIEEGDDDDDDEEYRADASSDYEESSSSEEEREEDERVTFTVITQDVKPVTIEIAQEDSAADVRAKISEKVGVPLEDLRLSRHDYNSLVEDDFMPSPGDILAVKSPTITVTADDGSKFELSALSETTVGDVKAYLEEQTGQSAEFLHIYPSESKSELSDDTPIKSDTNLRLEIVDPVEEEASSASDEDEAPSCFSVTAPDGQILTIEINENDLARDVRKKIAKQAGIPIKDLRLAKDGSSVDKKFLPSPGDALCILLPDIRISLPDGTKTKMPATASTTLDHVKAFLAKETGTAEDDQQLYCYGMNGKELVTKLPKTMDAVDLKMQTISKKLPTTITIETPDEESFTLEINDSETAKSVRKRIAKQAGVASKGLRLTMNGLEIDAKYMPSHGDVLTVEPPVVVIEFVDGETMELEAMPGTTVDDIKEILEDEMGILKSNQKLISTEPNGREWENDRQINKDIRFRLIEFEEEDLYDEITIEDSDDGEDTLDMDEDEMVHVDDGSPVNSPRGKLGAMEIRIQDSKSNYNHIYEFKSTTTISDIHNKIPSHSRVANNNDDQVLTFNGVALETAKTLAECEVNDGDALSLERYYINVNHFMTAILPFEDISSHDTVGSLKTKLARQQSLSKDDQLLTIQKTGMILDDNYKTLKQCGICHMDVLTLTEDNRSPASKVRDTVTVEKEELEGNLDERLAKIKERAEARKLAKQASKRRNL
ncbi:MAG: hypothetical protein SGILL_000931 [Bacillariaceae sp.]